METLPKVLGATSAAGNVQEHQHLNKLLLDYFIHSELGAKYSGTAKAEFEKNLPRNFVLTQSITKNASDMNQNEED